MKNRLRRLALFLPLFAASACDNDDARGGSPADFCTSLQGYVSSCSGGCEQALIRDCAPIERAFGSGFTGAVTSCMNNLGAPLSCVEQAVDQTPSSGALESFAQAMCLECGEGAGPCEGEVLAGNVESALGRAGRIARVLKGEVLRQVQDECAIGEGCAETFEDCAVRVLQRFVPGDTATCVNNAVQERSTGECELADDGGTGGEGGSATRGTSTGSVTSGGAGDTMMGDDTVTIDPTSDAMDGSGGMCDQEGCPCEIPSDCAGELICQDFECAPPVECVDDANEPNETEQGATQLAPITDEDAQGSTVGGELDGANDVDWYRYEGEDANLPAFALVNPFAQLNAFALDLCMYAECLSSLEDTVVTCPPEATQQASPGGRPGCCISDAPDGMELDVTCMNGFLGIPIGDDSATMYMSVGGGQPGVCQEYSLSYHY